ncbi:hypothetical protein BH20ACT2_BH20ACT2_18620 [soil metagenome]
MNTVARVLAVVVVVIIALFAYLWRLDVASWQGDEAIFATVSDDLLDSDGAAASDIGHPPLALFAFAAGQSIVGDDLLGVRLVGVLCGLGVAVGLFALVRRMAGWWAGILAALAWVALPHALVTAGVGLDKLDRYGRLEAVAALPLVFALYAGWRWVEGRDLRWAVVAGALGGLAAAAKVTFGVALVGVVLVGAVVHRRELRAATAHAGAMAATAVGAFALTYLPFGTDAWRRFTEMLSFQADHAGDGHALRIGDTIHDTAPWWANFWFTWRDDGPVPTLVLVGLAVAAVALPGRQRRAGAYLLVAVALPAASLAASPVALPHYRFVWLVPLVAAATLGVAALWRRRDRGPMVAALAVVVLGGVAVGHLINIATVQQSGYAEAAARVERAGLADGTVVQRGVRQVIERHLPGARLVTDLPADVVILDRGITDRRPDPALDAALESPVTDGSCRAVIDQLTVMFPDGDADECAALADR